VKTVIRPRRVRQAVHAPLETIKGRAYDHIRRGILDATLPGGTALSEYQLADQIGVSRTPVREALKRLEHEGLVRSVPRRGTFVADLSVRDIVEIYEVRIPLEVLAARVSAERMGMDEAKELLAELERVEKLALQGRVEAAREHDVHLHKRIIASTSNGRLAQILATLDDQVHRIRHRALSTPTRLSASLKEHRRVIEAILRRDSPGAEEAMRDHLHAARENAVQLALAGTPF